jgi:hypothetical protein
MVSRIVRVTIDDVLYDREHVALRLGDPPCPVPEPSHGSSTARSMRTANHVLR